MEGEKKERFEKKIRFERGLEEILKRKIRERFVKHLSKIGSY